MTTQVTDASLQMPFAYDMGILKERRFTRRISNESFPIADCIRISFFIIVQCIGPAICDTSFTDKHQGIAFPICFIKVSISPRFQAWVCLSSKWRIAFSSPDWAEQLVCAEKCMLQPAKNR